MNQEPNNVDKLLAERSKIEYNRNALIDIVSDLSERLTQIDTALCSSPIINPGYGDR